MTRTLLLAAGVLAAVAQGVSADFIFSDTRTPVPGSTTLERITISAFNNGKGYTKDTNSLFAMELTVNSSQPMVFNYTDLNNDGRQDVDLTASTNALGNSTITGTKVASELFGFMFDSGFDFDPNPRHLSTSSYNAVTAYTNASTFYALGATMTGPAIPASATPGAKFLTVVAPIGTTISLTGGIADEKGNIGTAGLMMALDSGAAANAAPSPVGVPLTPFSYVSAVPEPTSLAALAGATLLAALRRRA